MFSGAKGTLVKKSLVWSIAMMTITRPRMMSSEVRRPVAGTGPVPASSVVAGEESVDDVIAFAPETGSIYGDAANLTVLAVLWVRRMVERNGSKIVGSAQSATL